MSSIFPIKSEKKVSVEKPEVVELESERSEVVLDALSSKTTREVFLEIYEEESSISEISERTNNSIQNVKYHIEKLEESNLIEVARVKHTENGNQMKLYCPKTEAVVLVASQKNKEETLRSALKRMGGVTIFAGVLAAVLSRISSVSEDTLSRESPQIQTESQDVITSSDISTSSDIATDASGEVFQLSIGFISGDASMVVPAVFVFGVLVGFLSHFIAKKL
jgi:DNA-binding transcriptional ArsR family regulator